jgi:hypothetical protein
MIDRIERIFLDTNIYILGAADSECDEAKILAWLGFRQQISTSIEVILSQELTEQILRVAKRIRGKDWGSELLASKSLCKNLYQLRNGVKV